VADYRHRGEYSHRYCAHRQDDDAETAKGDIVWNIVLNVMGDFTHDALAFLAEGKV
jgi:hypothetical protein